MAFIDPLEPGQLCPRCDPEQFSFQTTDQLADLTEMIGQARAVEAVQFGVGIRREGYNLYVLGPAGVGKQTLVRQFLDQSAAAEPQPSDWCYVNNFEQPHKPIALQLPSGRGAILLEDMRQLVEELRAAIPAVFESEEYRTRAEQIEAEFTERQEKAFAEVGKDAAAQGIALLHTPSGFSFAPMRDKEVISPDQYAELPAEEQNRIEALIDRLQERLEKIIREVRKWQRERRARIKELNREITLAAVGHLTEELKERYGEFAAVLNYLDAFQHNVLESIDDFRKPPEAQTNILGLPAGEASAFRRYQVNLLVGDGAPQGAPVVFENHPSYQNLLGRVEHISQLGTLVTDFTLIKPGALHRANGGYLLLDAYKLLTQPFAWEGLKRALSTRQIRIESLGQMYSLVSTVSLEPEPIPLDVKVVLFGERPIYYLLYAYDPDFAELFKVAVDFEEEMPRNPANDLLHARLIGTMARREGMLSLNRAAVARIIEHGSRMVGDSEKLSTHMQAMLDLLREADYWARNDGNAVIAVDHVQHAIDAQLRRAGRLRERMQESILRNIVLIDSDGAKVGQVNGLSVFLLGDIAFAQPTRITANTRLGDGDVIDIQREVELGGAIHSKGVLILSSFLATRFSSSRPHCLSASLTFEQTYGEVEGDSASLAELCALLSSLADVPIKQSLAVTGSVNQHGQVQPIGAVNEKIEGFFDICQARGLTGEQGVLIPTANVKHLMLRRDVVEAAAAGKFYVYPVETIDQAIEILTGVAAGEPDVQGSAPEGSINALVATRLAELSIIRQAYAQMTVKVKRVRKPRKKEGPKPA